jgi:hypothetical protein
VLTNVSRQTACVCVFVCMCILVHLYVYGCPSVWLLIVVLAAMRVLLLYRHVHAFPFVPSHPHRSPPANPSAASTAENFSTSRLGIPAMWAKVHTPSASASAGPAGHTAHRPSAQHPPRCPPTVWFGVKLLLLWCGGGGGGCGPGLVSAQSSSSCPVGSFFNATTTQCATCPGGVFCVGRANPAIACPAGMHSLWLLDNADISCLSRVCPARVRMCMQTAVIIDPRDKSRVDALWLLPIIRIMCVSFELIRHGVMVAIDGSLAVVVTGLYCPLNASFPVVCPSGSYCGASAAAPTACPVGAPLSNLASADMAACSAYGTHIDQDQCDGVDETDVVSSRCDCWSLFFVGLTVRLFLQ